MFVLWGRVYDYSCGYGGRLLGIGSSNFKYDYIGVEPNTETVNYLNYLNSIIDEATGVRGTIIQNVSEDYKPEDIDLAFSSPFILTWRSIVMKKHNVWYVIRQKMNGLSGYVESHY